MSNDIAAQGENARTIFQAFRDLEMDAYQLQSRLGEALKLERSSSEGSNTIRVTWTGPKDLVIRVDKSHVLHALDVLQAALLTSERICEWAELLILLDEVYELGASEDRKVGAISSVLHYLADGPCQELDRSSIAYLRSCLMQDEPPNLSCL